MSIDHRGGLAGTVGALMLASACALSAVVEPGERVVLLLERVGA